MTDTDMLTLTLTHARERESDNALTLDTLDIRRPLGDGVWEGYTTGDCVERWIRPDYVEVRLGLD